MPLVNCEISLILTWSASCVITSKLKREADLDADSAVNRIDIPTGATFKTADTRLYVPVVTLSTQDDNKLLEQLKRGFEKSIKWNECRSEMSNQSKNNNLKYLIDPTFAENNTLFVLSFKNGDDRTSFFKYYTTNVVVNTSTYWLIETFFDNLIKYKEEAYKKINQFVKDNEYAATNLLDYEYF